MENKDNISFKKARFRLSESCCTSTAKIIDIDENDEICTNSLDELMDEKNIKDKDHNECNNSL